ncbi:MAG: GNAT family N-acetyltransferase [Candidatus Schekmanbacteria bacterium]|nr:GNAT family N-acetyltransferase [Candidatus Schekmanbacteria bacterium]
MTLQVTVVRDPDELDTCREAWDALVDASPDSELFYTRQWLEPWIAAFWSPRPLAFLLAWDGDRLSGMAPFLEDAESEVLTAPPLCSGALALPLNGHARRSGVLVAGAVEDVVDAMLQHLRDTRRRPRLRLGTGLAGAAGRRAWAARAPRLGLRACERPADPSPAIAIEGSWQAYLASRASHVQHELGRKLRRLQQQPDLRWRLVTTPGEVEAAWRDVLAIEDHSWKSESGESLHDASPQRFYVALARSAAEQHWLRLHLLDVAGQPIAYLFAVAFRDTLYALKTSYDQRHAALSPGMMVVVHALRAAFEEQLDRCDLLGFPARWKQELANSAAEHIQLCVHGRRDPRCLLCTVAEKRLRPLVGRQIQRAAALLRRGRP